MFAKRSRLRLAVKRNALTGLETIGVPMPNPAISFGVQIFLAIFFVDRRIDPRNRRQKKRR